MPSRPIEVPDAEPNQPPDGHAVAIGIAEYEREQTERQEWLASPEAIKQREASWLAFSEITASESEGLLRTLFAEQLANLNGDPSRYLSDAQLVRPIEESGGVVRDESGTSLLESNLPIRVEDESGDLKKVDLTLESTPEGFKTANALADVVLPSSGDALITVGEKGFGIAQAGAAESQASRFGDKNLFYPEVLPDTDLFIAVTSAGAELFDLLRSRESPEELRFDIEVPPGAELRADDLGGAEVVREGKILTRIPRPSAVDAQGTDIPVELRIEQSAILLHVPHRKMDLAYPALVDPIVEDWANTAKSWYYGNSLGELPGPWEFEGSGNSNIDDDTCCWDGSHPGLLTKFKAAFYGPEQKGEWKYNTGNPHIYIPHAWITPFTREDKNCGSQQPHDYAGMWSPGWWNPLKTDEAKKWGTLSMDGIGQWLVLGLSSGPPGVNLACDRVLYAGGVAIWLDDVYPPAISVSGIPTDWFSDEDVQSIKVNASDEGLGVQRTQLNPAGMPVIKDEPGCLGYWHSRCPTSRPSSFSPSGKSFREGIQDLDVVSADPTGKMAEQDFETKVDYSPPKVTLNGQLAEATKEVGQFTEENDPAGFDKLRLPVYELQIKAEDGVWGTTHDEDKRSGVKDIKVFLNGEEMTEGRSWKPNTSCPATSCKLEGTYTLALSEIEVAGKHELEVKVEDFAENVREREIEFEYFPATGMKDEYVMHYFPLPNGQGNEEEEESPVRPELAVNVMNGNLVYRERDVDVEGSAGVDLEVERFYNSQLPAAEDTEWGDGWTLAQTPSLEPIDTEGSPAPDQAELRDSSGALREGVSLPGEVGATQFNPALRASLTMRDNGGYELTDETAESATSVVFDSTGQTEARLTDGYAKVDYRYEGGDLAEIEVTDPATFAADSSELEIPEPELISAPEYNGSFGKNGSGDGQFKYPTDVAIDFQGNLWVTDKSNNRIQKFDPSGKFIAKYGSSGSGNGQFSRPSSVAIDAAGNVLIADSNNHRVQKLSPEGAFISKFGSSGSGNGQLNKPEEVIVDSAGNIWVADTQNGRVQKFNSAGEFVSVFDAGYLYEPTGVDVDAGGNVWVADYQKHRITVFDSSGNFKSNVGSAGSGNGQFNRLDGLEIDNVGNVWVGDLFNNRIQRFDLAGQYQGQFGTAGSGAGQFGLDFPMGIAADSKGHLWITDPYNDRLQEWRVPIHKPIYSAAFGANGSGDGQFKYPGDVAVDLQGNFWVADKSNNRIQKFDASGEFIAKYGSFGSGNGQFNRPSSIAVDRDGNILVADSNNHRVQKLDTDGQFISKFGTSGSGNGQLNKPEEVTPDAKGNIWVADTQNGRAQKFDEEGQFVKVFDSGYLYEPTGVDVDAGGNVWVADWQKNRITVFDPEGNFKSNVGSAGSGNGQFNRLDGLEIDDSGNVWVGDLGNNRIQRFDVAGQYQGQLGTPGTGQGQFGLDFPMGIAADREGYLWIADPYNHRVQKWLAANYAPAEEVELDLSDGDPEVEVETPGGLVASVTGNAAGEHDYEHDGDLLVSHDGPEGEVDYDYDDDRLIKVTLPNGTWAEIEYEAVGRVEEVTVSIEGGEAKATHFLYKDDAPRRTIVTPSDAPHVTYEIGEDGSVLKWWNTQKPPTIDVLAGTLSDYREDDGALWAGEHNLYTHAFSAEGIKSINVIANGSVLVDERFCDEDLKTEKVECEEEENEWVTETDLHPQGHLNLEVIVTDYTGQSSSERFWVDIPAPPPPLALGTPVPPRFRDIARFREDYGLEVVFPVANEVELNKRIFNLIKAWYEAGTPAGQVARASMDRWGVPLRPADVAELEYRERYFDNNAEPTAAWAEASYPGTYGGYYIDHRAGGILRVGFVQDQEARLTDLKGQLSLEAEDRLAVYPTAPSAPLVSLASAFETLDTALDTNATFQSMVTELSISEAGNEISIGTTSVSPTQQIVGELIGSQVPTDIYPGAARTLASGRHRTSGRMRAGDRILNKEGACTAGFGAFEERPPKPNDEKVTARFVLTAGHCFALDGYVHRSNRADSEEPENWAPVGQVTRQAVYGSPPTDGLAIRAKIPNLVPHGIFGSAGNLVPTGHVAKARVGNTLCYSGARLDGVSCGEVTRLSMGREGPLRYGEYNVKFNRRVNKGDSGGPVWNPRTGAAVGVVSSFYPDTPISTVTPLLHPKGLVLGRVPGILHHPDMFDMHLIAGG